MKFRTDYVTNSSSSSYIVAFKNFKELEQELQQSHPMIKTLFNAYYHFLTHGGDTISTMDELNKYFLDRYGCQDTIEELLEDEGEWLNEKYNEFKDKIENGYSITMFDVEYGSEDVINRIFAGLDGDTVVVLDRE